MSDNQGTIFIIDLSQAGDQMVRQFAGVLRVIEMADSAGNLDLTGVINVRVGQTKGPTFPLRMNNAYTGRSARDLKLSWEAQSGVFAKLLLSPDGQTFDVDADPPVQLVTGALSSSITAADIDVASTATEIVAANTSRQALTIWNNGSETIYLGGSGVTTSTGLPLEAGTGVDFSHTTAAIYGICSTGPVDTRYLEEG